MCTHPAAQASKATEDKVTSFLVVLFLVASSLIGQTLTSGTRQSSPDDVKPCLVQGRVTDSSTGEPVGQATLRLQLRSPSGESKSYLATSEADGTYKFENIEPGYYSLIVTRSGYADTAYRATFAMPAGDVVRLRPGQQMTDVQIGLTPLGVIAGRVVDQNGGPVVNALVQLLRLDWYRGTLRTYGQNSAATDNFGQYRIRNVRPGKYDLVVQPVGRAAANNTPVKSEKRDVRTVRTYYPSAVSLDNATALSIKSGQELTGIDIALQTAATYHIRGRISGALPDGTTDNVRLMLSPADGGFISRGLQDISMIAKDNSFDYSGVAPGSYTVCLLSTNGPMKLLARQDLEVKQSDVNNVQLAISHSSIQGTVTIENNLQPGIAALSLKDLRITLHGAERAIMLSGLFTSPVGEDGTFKLQDLPPGKYDFFVSGAAPRAYESSVLFDNKEVVGQELDLAHGGGQVNVVLRYGPASLKGIVIGVRNYSTSVGASRGRQPVPLPDVTLALVADTAPEDFYGIRTSPVSFDGRFGMSNIYPHRYRAYAIEKLDTNQLQNPDFLKQLENRATEINLLENDSKQIQLPLITAEEMQQIYSRLGIDCLLPYN